jgi:hypothetical protein
LRFHPNSEFGRIFLRQAAKKTGYPGLRYRSGPGAPRRGCSAPLLSLARKNKKTTDHAETTDKKREFFLFLPLFPLPPVRSVSVVSGSLAFFYFFCVFSLLF